MLVRRNKNPFSPTIMNTPRLIFCFTAVITLLYGTFSLKNNVLMANNSAEEVEEPLLVAVGYVVDEEGKNLKGCEVTLFRNNDSLETVNSKGSGKFEFILNRNDYYTLEIRQPGFYTKRVAISTLVPGTVDEIQDFDFTIGMVNIGSFEGVDTFVLDFPTTKIVFHKTRKEFVYDKEYTSAIRAEVDQLYDEARELKAAKK